MPWAIKLVKTRHPRTPWMVAVPAVITGTKRVRRYFKEREAAAAYVIRVRQQGFLGAEEGQGTNGGAGKTTLGECAALWLARLQEHRPTFFQCRQVLNRLVARHGREPIDVVGHRELDTWLRSLKGLGPVTVHNHWRITLRFFGWCQDFLEVIPRNPMKRLQERRLEHRDPEILTPEQMKACLVAAAGERRLIAYLALGGFAGMRTDEILRLPWADIDWAPGEIYVAQPKRVSGWRPRHVEILPALRRHLEPVALTDHKLVVPGGQRTLYLLRRELMDQLGWDAWPRNCLRHSYKSYHLAQWQDRSRLAEQMGHSDGDMARYSYGSPVVRAHAAAWWEL
jgi:integrase